MYKKDKKYIHRRIKEKILFLVMSFLGIHAVVTQFKLKPVLKLPYERNSNNEDC